MAGGVGWGFAGRSAMHLACPTGSTSSQTLRADSAPAARNAWIRGINLYDSSLSAGLGMD